KTANRWCGACGRYLTAERPDGFFTSGWQCSNCRSKDISYWRKRSPRVEPEKPSIQGKVLNLLEVEPTIQKEEMNRREQEEQRRQREAEQDRRRLARADAEREVEARRRAWDEAGQPEIDYNEVTQARDNASLCKSQW